MNSDNRYIGKYIICATNNIHADHLDMVYANEFNASMAYYNPYFHEIIYDTPQLKDGMYICKIEKRYTKYNFVTAVVHPICQIDQEVMSNDCMRTLFTVNSDFLEYFDTRNYRKDYDWLNLITKAKEIDTSIDNTHYSNSNIRKVFELFISGKLSYKNIVEYATIPSKYQEEDLKCQRIINRVFNTIDENMKLNPYFVDYIRNMIQTDGYHHARQYLEKILKIIGIDRASEYDDFYTITNIESIIMHRYCWNIDI